MLGIKWEMESKKYDSGVMILEALSNRAWEGFQN